MSTNTALDQIKNRAEGHTEGPWHWPGTHARRELHGAGGEVMTCATLLWPDKPDAELIAAAPKLLAALEAVEELAANAPRMITFTGATVSGIVLADDVLKAIEGALR